MQGSLAGYKFKYIVPVRQTRSGHPDKVRGAVEVDGHITVLVYVRVGRCGSYTNRLPVVCTKWGNGERFRLIHADGRTRHPASFTRVSWSSCTPGLLERPPASGRFQCRFLMKKERF